MDCEHAQLLINARIDGERIDAPAALDAHLAGCSACRAVADALREQDAALEQAFAPRRDAALAMAQRVGRAVQGPSRKRAQLSRWLVPLVSAAAGFALAVVLLWVVQEPVAPTVVDVTSVEIPAPADAPVLATLALATGAVEIRPSSAEAWQPMATGGIIRSGDLVRTGPKVRCEFLTPEGSQVRLNAETEVCFREPRLLELAAGQLWSTVEKATVPFRVQVPDATVTALGTQFDLLCRPGEATVTVAEGSTSVRDSFGEKIVRSGERLTISNGRAGEPRRARDLIVATRWVNEILVMKGRDNEELSRRIDDLFAQIGQDKVSYLYAEEIRALGDHCVLPLSRYITSDRSKGEDEKRVMAAEILADVAQPWAAGELIALLRDHDPAVRFHAAAALHRVTGTHQGRSPEQWRDQPPAASRAALAKWEKWWNENRQRFPGAVE